jgi:hypothetical protein
MAKIKIDFNISFDIVTILSYFIPFAIYLEQISLLIITKGLG